MSAKPVPCMIPNPAAGHQPRTPWTGRGRRQITATERSTRTTAVHAIRLRSAASRTGGQWSTPILMKRYVEPQRKDSARKATTTGGESRRSSGAAWLGPFSSATLVLPQEQAGHVAVVVGRAILPVPAARDGQVRPGDVGGPLRREEHDRLRDLLRTPHASHRHPLEH